MIAVNSVEREPQIFNYQKHKLPKFLNTLYMTAMVWQGLWIGWIPNPGVLKRWCGSFTNPPGWYSDNEKIQGEWDGVDFSFREERHFRHILWRRATQMFFHCLTFRTPLFAFKAKGISGSSFCYTCFTCWTSRLLLVFVHRSWPESNFPTILRSSLIKAPLICCPYIGNWLLTLRIGRVMRSI